MVSMISTIGMWIYGMGMWIYKMDHVAFELWLGQGNPRRPVHCACNKTKRRQKRSHENHTITLFFPRYLTGKLRGKNEKKMQGILEKWNAHSCVCFILRNVPQIFMLRNVTYQYTRIFCPVLDLLLVSFALPIRV